jgi:hypothetical protein
MDMLWPLPVILAVGVVLVVMLRVGPRLFPGTRHSQRAFWCPYRGRDVEVEFEETVWQGELCDVDRCTAFDPPSAVDCDKKCVRLRSLPPRRRQAVHR